MSEWISVKDRLPEEGSTVLVYRPNAPESGDSVVRTTIYQGGNHWQRDFACFVQPTHWMELPAPPTK